MANTICWFDLFVRDLDRAMDFYSNVVGVDLEVQKYQEIRFAVFKHSRGDVAGCLVEQKDYKPSTEGILIYFDVNDYLDSALKQVVKFGGKVEMAKHAIGSHGFRAIILDSEGNKIALHSRTN